MFKRLVLGSLLSCIVVGQSFGMNTNQKLLFAGGAGSAMVVATGLVAGATGLVGGVVDCSSEGAALGALGFSGHLMRNALNPEIIEFQRQLFTGQPFGYSQAEAADGVQAAKTTILVIGGATAAISGGYLAKRAHDCIIS